MCRCTRHWGFPGGSVVKNLHAKQELWVQSLGWEDPLEMEMATHSSVLAWRVPWTGDNPWGRLQSMGSQKSPTWFSNYTITDTDLLNPLEFPGWQGGNVFCSHKVTLPRLLNSSRMEAAHQKDQAMIRSRLPEFKNAQSQANTFLDELWDIFIIFWALA